MNMKTNNNQLEYLWKQIKEENEDYQYFKVYDKRELDKTLSNIKKQGYALTN